MKCLVTGGAGFIGSNLVSHLIENKGYIVEVWDNISTGSYDNLHEDAFFRWLDITEEIDECHLSNWDVIFHLAALPRIQASMKNPVGTSKANVLGTQNVLEVARKTGTRVVYAGSSSFYADPLKNPYSFTKWIGEEYCKMYNQVWNVPVAITRFFNVYGPGHDRDAEFTTVVAAFEKCMIDGEPFKIYGDGSKRRDFTHVYDIVKGMTAASYHEWQGDIFNLGRAENCSIKELAEMFDPSNILYFEDRPGEAQETLADIKETTNKLHWSPRENLSSYVYTFMNNLKRSAQ